LDAMKNRKTTQETHLTVLNVEAVQTDVDDVENPIWRTTPVTQENEKTTQEDP